LRPHSAMLTWEKQRASIISYMSAPLGLIWTPFTAAMGVSPGRPARRWRPRKFHHVHEIAQRLGPRFPLLLHLIQHQSPGFGEPPLRRPPSARRPLLVRPARHPRRPEGA